MGRAHSWLAYGTAQTSACEDNEASIASIGRLQLLQTSEYDPCLRGLGRTDNYWPRRCEFICLAEVMRDHRRAMLAMTFTRTSCRLQCSAHALFLAWCRAGCRAGLRFDPANTAGGFRQG